MSSMNSAEIEYIWEAIRESERSDENLPADAVHPKPGHSDFIDEDTAQADALHRTTAEAEKPTGVPCEDGDT